MIKCDDLIPSIGKYLLEHDYWYLNFEDKKQRIDEGLRIYIFNKIREEDSARLSDIKEMDVLSLLHILDEMVPEENKMQVISQFSHYIQGIIGELQQYFILWHIGDDPDLISNPIIVVEEGFCKEIITHKKTDYYQVFCLLYGIFTNKLVNRENAIGAKKNLEYNQGE